MLLKLFSFHLYCILKLKMFFQINKFLTPETSFSLFLRLEEFETGHEDNSNFRRASLPHFEEVIQIQLLTKLTII